MESWLTYPEYQAICPDNTVADADFPALASAAALCIESQTHWRACTADDPEQLAILAQCQAQLIRLNATAQSSVDAGLSGVTSVNNHGYSESYASAQQMQAALEQQRRQIVHQALSAPQTRWMLYNGGAYRTPRCR